MNNQLIYLIDDDNNILTTISNALRDNGYRVETATGGEATLSRITTITPDLFLIDLRMNPMNGFELFHRIREKRQFLTTPIFFLTGIEDQLARQYGEKLGVEGYFTKPIDIAQLLAAIARALGVSSAT